MATITLDTIRKIYAGNVEAVKGVSIDIADGEFIVLVGPSGCGKSTLLRMIAGLEAITSGEAKIGDRVVNNVDPADRDIAMVFQNYALYPHMSIFDNMGFSLKLRKRPKSEIEEKVLEAAEILNLKPYLERAPGQLSGGQRQRVGICRALIQQPELLLVDEPTASLDPKTSRQIMRLIRELCEERRLSAIINIHDVLLAQMFAERIVGLQLGEIVYDGPPDGLTPDVLTQIYGEEDWEATIEKVDEDEEEVPDAAPNRAAGND